VPGVAQVWLTENELRSVHDAVVDALYGGDDGDLETAREKLDAAISAVACPVPSKPTQWGYDDPEPKRTPPTCEEMYEARKEGRLRELFMGAAAPCA